MKEKLSAKMLSKIVSNLKQKLENTFKCKNILPDFTHNLKSVVGGCQFATVQLPGHITRFVFICDFNVDCKRRLIAKSRFFNVLEA